MKEGRTLQEVAQMIQHRREAAKDFTAPCAMLGYNAELNELLLDGIGGFKVKDLAHEQIAARLEIPKKYYDRMREEQPKLLEENINTWLQSSPAEQRLIRTLDGDVRAYLSHKYRPLDDFDMLESVVPTLAQTNCRIESCDITEKRFYLKAVSNNIEFMLPDETLEEAKASGRFKGDGKHDRRDDVLQAGLVVSNSEVGCGGLNIEPLVWRRVCSNGLIISEACFKKFHIGKSTSNGEGAYEFFRDDTRLADDRALWLKVRDTVAHVFEQVNFEGIAARMHEAKSDIIEVTGVKCIEVAQKMFSLNDAEGETVLSCLLRDGDMSRFGLMNAVTAASQEIGDYERATDFERLGGKILDLPRSTWKQLAGEGAKK